MVSDPKLYNPKIQKSLGIRRHTSPTLTPDSPTPTRSTGVQTPL